jgi:glycosyltransferase involved in cell wall biosynthesis
VRVLYFHRNDGVHDQRFLDALGRLPVEVFSLQLDTPTESVSRWKPAANIQLLKIPRETDRLFWFQIPKIIAGLQRIIKEYQVDVIHAGPVDQCAWLAARAGVSPLVSMSWGFDLLVNASRNPIHHRRIQYTLHRTDILLDDCQTVSNAAMRYGFPAERIVSFPWGVDLQVYIPREVKNSVIQPVAEKTITLISTRTMEKMYGCDLIVDAFIKAAGQEEKLRLIMLGDGSQRQKLMRRITAARLEERVHFAGNVPETEMITHFHSSDIYISASHSDGSSVSLLQAMACGLPVIVSGIPGNREWVSEGRNGWLFTDGDKNELTRLILEACHSMELRSIFGKESRRIVVDRADWKKNSARLMDVYQMAVGFAQKGTVV